MASDNHQKPNSSHKRMQIYQTSTRPSDYDSRTSCDPHLPLVTQTLTGTTVIKFV